MHLIKGFFAFAFVAAVFLAGCGQNRETSHTSTDTTAVMPVPVPAPSPTATDTPAWVAELRQDEAALGQTVEQGRLADVHERAIKLQTLLKQVVGQAGNLTPEQQQQLNEHLSAANRLVNELHHAGDAGDLSKTKAKFLEFQTHLRAVEGVFGVAQP